MIEIKKILRSLGAEKSAERKYALATVVQVEGSAYRKPGARMLISDKGQSVGAISGGCLKTMSGAKPSASSCNNGLHWCATKPPTKTIPTRACAWAATVRSIF